MARAAEACFLLRVLSEHNIGRLAARMEEGYRAQLRVLRFRCAAGVAPCIRPLPLGPDTGPQLCCRALSTP